ncbi:MAG TPA: pyridoxal phosphate-dependent aminotransferase [Solirubrobacter sp.]|nr:pyridoxal phosphate-dependent aminotransferase [Solirubrobacter sp.]
MRRFLGYYRQFDELSPDEISSELRARREAERRRELAQHPLLDLSGAAWHGPPHPEVVNAATFALRRAVNAYPDASPLREAIAAAHGVAVARVVVGHGAGELLRAALRAVAAPGAEVAIAWPGWGPLPQLVAEAGAKPVPVALEALFEGPAGAPAARAGSGGAGAAAGSAGRPTTVITRPADPTGAVVPLADLQAFARGLAPDAWLILDEALAGFLPDGEDGLVDHPRAIHVRSFSKDHAMAGFRIGYAIVPERAEAPLAPVLGVAAPALAGALWAVQSGAGSVRRRRAQAAEQRARLEAALAGSSFHPAPGHGPYVWLAAPGGPALAEALAARRIFVAPGTAWGDEHHVRVTLRDSAATDRLVAALRELT